MRTRLLNWYISEVRSWSSFFSRLCELQGRTCVGKSILSKTWMWISLSLSLSLPPSPSLFSLLETAEKPENRFIGLFAIWLTSASFTASPNTINLSGYSHGLLMESPHIHCAPVADRFQCVQPDKKHNGLNRPTSLFRFALVVTTVSPVGQSCILINAMLHAILGNFMSQNSTYIYEG